MNHASLISNNWSGSSYCIQKKLEMTQLVFFPRALNRCARKDVWPMGRSFFSNICSLSAPSTRRIINICISCSLTRRAIQTKTKQSPCFWENTIKKNKYKMYKRKMRFAWTGSRLCGATVCSGRLAKGTTTLQAQANSSLLADSWPNE